MSQAGVEQLIGRMITDDSFRLAVAADADKALASFDLTTDERDAFRQGHLIDWDQAADVLDKRTTPGLYIPN